MSRRLSLNARTTQDASHASDFEVVLLEIDHAEFDAPLRLSTDPTERLSSDPLRYGTRSTWRGADPLAEPFSYIIASLELPGDEEDVPAGARIILDLFDHSVVSLLRSVSTRATAHLAVVMASSPDLIEQEWTGLQVMSAAYGQAIEVPLSRRPIEEEAAPMDIIGRDRFPGLFR